MSDPINHHYLPVFYLNQWCGSGGKLFRFWRPHDRVIAHAIAPKNTAFEPALYGLEACPPERRNAIERELMGPLIDGPAAIAMQILLGGDDSKLTLERRSDWTRFLMSLRIRTPPAVARIDAVAKDGVLQDLSAPIADYDAFRGKDDPPTLYEWAEKNKPAVVANFGKQLFVRLLGDENIGEQLIRMRWFKVNVARSRFSLLTSDNPLVMTHGVTDERCVVALPLSPRVGFLAARRVTTIENIAAQHPDLVALRFNESIVGQAVKHVYGDTRSHLRFVENRLRSQNSNAETPASG